jgi:hypothetical protein
MDAATLRECLAACLKPANKEAEEELDEAVRSWELGNFIYEQNPYGDGLKVTAPLKIGQIQKGQTFSQYRQANEGHEDRKRIVQVDGHAWNRDEHTPVRFRDVRDFTVDDEALAALIEAAEADLKTAEADLTSREATQDDINAARDDINAARDALTGLKAAQNKDAMAAERVLKAELLKKIMDSLFWTFRGRSVRVIKALAIPYEYDGKTDPEDTFLYIGYHGQGCD